MPSRSRLRLLLAAAVTGLLVGRYAVPGRAREAGDDQVTRLSPVPPVTSIAPLVSVVLAILVIATVWLTQQTWSASRQADAVARAITGGDPERAPPLIRRYGCGGCHSVPGVAGADGQVAGPLGAIGKRVFIAGTLPNTAANMVDWIVQPQAHAPHAAMPATGISRAEARDVAAYLYAH